MTFKPCIVIPVYNHGTEVCVLLPRLAPLGLRVYLVNDGSHDDCVALLHQAAETDDWVEVIDHAQNRGKGGAVLSGLRAASRQGYSHALQIDADGQHDPGDIPRFLTTAAENPGAVVTGQPVFDDSVPKGRLAARYLTHVWVWIETLSFSIPDSMCGFRVYPLDEVLPLAERTRLGQRMDFDPEVLVRLYWKGTPIVSLPTAVKYPLGGASHFRLFHDNLLITRMHVRLFFGMLWRAPMLLYRRAALRA